MSKPDFVNYLGLTLGDFPLLALTFTKYPRHIGDLPGEYKTHTDFKAASDKSYKAHTQVGIGLLGIKLPTTPKSPSETKYYGFTILNFPVAAVITKKQPGQINDVQADWGREASFESSTDPSIPAHTSVAFGLLGIRVPIKK